MKLFVFAVKDAAIDGFLPPMFVPHKGLAERWFEEQQGQDNQIGKHPEHHSLYELGEWNPDTGKFKNNPQPQLITVGQKR